MKLHLGLVMVLAAFGALVLSQGAASAVRPTSALSHPTLRDVAAEGDEEFEFDEAEAEAELEECEPTDEALESADEGDEEGFEEEELEPECGEDDGALEAAAKGAPSVSAPPACKVREAESKIAVVPGSGELRLTVRYSTWSPTQVTVGVKLKDHKGSALIVHSTKHVGSHGVLHVDTKLGAGLMQRALKASELDVSLRAPDTPGSCAGALEQRLHTVKHAGPRAPRVYAG